MWSEDAMNYCKKEGDFWEWGKFLLRKGGKGSRNDILPLIKKYNSYQELISDADNI